MPEIIKKKQEKNKFKENIFLFFSKYYKFIVLIICFFIFAIIFLRFIYPKFIYIKDKIEKSKIDQNQILEDRTSYYNRLNKFIESFNKITTNDRTVIDRIIPDKFDTEEIMAEMELLISSGGFSLDEIKVAQNDAAESENTGLKKLSVDITVSEVYSYEEFKELLQLIEKNMRILDITSLEYSSERDSYSFNMSTYYFE